MRSLSKIHKYGKREDKFRNAVSALEGKTLHRAVVQVVDPEFNQVYLDFENVTFAICGQFGGELITVGTVDSIPSQETDAAMVSYQPIEIWDQFIGKAVSQARTIGEAWNGHGMELSFHGIPSQTLIIQSVECLGKPDVLNDALRLGVGVYLLTTDNEYQEAEQNSPTPTGTD